MFKMLFLDSWIPLYLQQVMQEKRFISKLNWKRLDSRFNHSLNLWARYIIIKLLHKVTKRVLTLYCVIASIILTYFFRHCVYCTYTLQWWTQGFTRGVFITWQKREGRPDSILRGVLTQSLFHTLMQCMDYKEALLWFKTKKYFWRDINLIYLHKYFTASTNLGSAAASQPYVSM